MKTTYVFPGTFSPPTYGHLEIVKMFCEVVDELTIICSENPNKSNNWFSPEECCLLWQTYDLPRNVEVTTLEKFRAKQINNEDIVIMRGLRNENDFMEEKKVISLNLQHGVNKYFYCVSKNEHSEISSSSTRNDASLINLKNLSQKLSPLAVSAVLEKSMQIKNLFLVTGRTGSGKSTFLSLLSAANENNYVIKTDEFNHELRELVKAEFGDKDLIDAAIEEEVRLNKVIANRWFELLSNSLRSAPKDSNVFIEAAYGLQPTKSLFKYLGGKIINISCNTSEENVKRTKQRGTPELVKFITIIPDRNEADEIAKDNNLLISHINTSCSLDVLKEKAQNLSHLISINKNHAYKL